MPGNFVVGAQPVSAEAIEVLERQKQEIIDSCTRRVAELDAWIAEIRAEEEKAGSKGPVQWKSLSSPGSTRA